MTKLPRNVKPLKMVSIVEKLGFHEIGRKGSHRRYSHSDGRITQIVVHNKPIPIGTLRAILRQIKVTSNELLQLL